jgi:hypothetical protein
MILIFELPYPKEDAKQYPKVNLTQNSLSSEVKKK